MKLHSVRVPSIARVTKGGLLSSSVRTHRQLQCVLSCEPALLDAVGAVTRVLLVLVLLLAAGRVPANGQATQSGASASVVVTCPPDVQLQCRSSIDPSITGAALVANCAGPVTISFSDLPLPGDCTEQGIQRTWVVVGCGGQFAC